MRTPCADDALDELDGLGALRGDRLGQLHGGRQELLGLDDLLDQPDAQGLVGADHLAGQEELEGVAEADEAGQALRRRRSRG